MYQLAIFTKDGWVLGREYPAFGDADAAASVYAAGGQLIRIQKDGVTARYRLEQMVGPADGLLAEYPRWIADALKTKKGTPEGWELPPMDVEPTTLLIVPLPNETDWHEYAEWVDVAGMMRDLGLPEAKNIIIRRADATPEMPNGVEIEIDGVDLDDERLDARLHQAMIEMGAAKTYAADDDGLLYEDADFDSEGGDDGDLAPTL